MATKDGLVLIYPEPFAFPMAVEKGVNFRVGWLDACFNLVKFVPIRGLLSAHESVEFPRITATEAVALHFIAGWKETHQHPTLTIKESMKMYGIQRLPVIIPRINKRLPSGVWIECEMVRESSTLQYGKWKLHDPDNQFRFLVQGVR